MDQKYFPKVIPLFLVQWLTNRCLPLNQKEVHNFNKILSIQHVKKVINNIRLLADFYKDESSLKFFTVTLRQLLKIDQTLLSFKKGQKSYL